MVTDRQNREMIARCVSLMVFFRSSHKTPKARAVVLDEARQVATWAVAANLSGEEVRANLLEPVRQELIDRYGATIGSRLAATFCAAFEGADEPGPIAT